jgi:hypothetical protein
MAIIAPAISSGRRSSGRFITSIGRLRFAVTTFNDRAQLCFAHVGQRGQAGFGLRIADPDKSAAGLGVKRRYIGSSFIEDKTACSKMFLRKLRRKTMFFVFFDSSLPRRSLRSLGQGQEPEARGMQSGNMDQFG